MAGFAPAIADPVGDSFLAKPSLDADSVADAQRRFGGLARLYGQAGAASIARARVVVVGLGTYFSHRFVERSRTTVQAKQG